jgi:hypothetical protein
LSPNVVYIQFKDDGDRELAKKLMQSLKLSGFTAPGVEQIAPKNFPAENEIRYFNDTEEEKKLAQSVADAAQAFFQKEHIEVHFSPPKLIHLQAPPGQIEIWFNVDSQRSTDGVLGNSG